MALRDPLSVGTAVFKPNTAGLSLMSRLTADMAKAKALRAKGDEKSTLEAMKIMHSAVKTKYSYDMVNYLDPMTEKLKEDIVDALVAGNGTITPAQQLDFQYRANKFKEIANNSDAQYLASQKRYAYSQANPDKYDKAEEYNIYQAWFDPEEEIARQQALPKDKRSVYYDDMVSAWDKSEKNPVLFRDEFNPDMIEKDIPFDSNKYIDSLKVGTSDVSYTKKEGGHTQSSSVSGTVDKDLDAIAKDTYLYGYDERSKKYVKDEMDARVKADPTLGKSGLDYWTQQVKARLGKTKIESKDEQDEGSGGKGSGSGQWDNLSGAKALFYITGLDKQPYPVSVSRSFGLGKGVDIASVAPKYYIDDKGDIAEWTGDLSGTVNNIREYNIGGVKKYFATLQQDKTGAIIYVPYTDEVKKKVEAANKKYSSGLSDIDETTTEDEIKQLIEDERLKALGFGNSGATKTNKFSKYGGVVRKQ